MRGVEKPWYGAALQTFSLVTSLLRADWFR